MNDYLDAKTRMETLLHRRARELYPHFNDMWSETAIGYEDGAFTQEDALKEAAQSLESGKTAAEWKQEKEASRRVVRHFYLSPEEDEAIRVMAFRSGRSRNDIMVEMIREGLSEVAPK